MKTSTRYPSRQARCNRHAKFALFFLGGRIVHFFLQKVGHGLLVPFQKFDHPVDALLAILLRRDEPDARRAALADMMVEAGGRTITVLANNIERKG